MAIVEVQRPYTHVAAHTRGRIVTSLPSQPAKHPPGSALGVISAVDDVIDVERLCLSVIDRQNRVDGGTVAGLADDITEPNHDHGDLATHGDHETPPLS